MSLLKAYLAVPVGLPIESKATDTKSIGDDGGMNYEELLE